MVSKAEYTYKHTVLQNSIRNGVRGARKQQGSITIDVPVVFRTRKKHFCL